jgi:phosphoribosylamine--glycine ligase
MEKINVLILGSGGREYTLAWKISQSKYCHQLYIAPGNAGTGKFGENLALNMLDFAQIGQAVIEKNISMVVVGPEEPLVKGIHDFFLADSQLSGVSVIGPVKAGALLEGSKDFAKNFMNKYQIPTARYATFTAESYKDGAAFLKELKPPYVLKADGLAAGKGVVILSDRNEAEKVLSEMLIDKKFGAASSKVVIEEFLDGIELSVFALLDGKNYVMLPEAKDYKRIGEGDTGLNTGGMGSVSPVPFADKQFMNKVEERVIRPTVQGLISEGVDYKGFIFAGLMNVKGDPYIIEYNVRLGDPETETILPRISSDFLVTLMAVSKGELENTKLTFDSRSAACVMLVSGGYPGDYRRDLPMKIIESNEVEMIHAGTKRNAEGNIVTSGGRVLAVMAFGANLKDALKRVYQNTDSIEYEDSYYRKDIGSDLF